ncbi:hypothetical protein [Zhihengliuella sp. ISTPL4]|uniref:hypothetical protein n=1 Tax=Zhihengliuella sp. ISTPL4 TaxID=2058657 RepID=UPI000C7C7A90|nr:hypothetical protein [Zhihengliuella sp. ISTPL4]
MHWESLFDDLEGQLAAEWEAERAARDAESERLRVARLDLRTRLRHLCGAQAAATLHLADGAHVPVGLRSLGVDWLAAVSRVPQGAGVPSSVLFIPASAIFGLTVDHGSLLASLSEAERDPTTLRERMTLGFILRDLARRRLPVRLRLLAGDDLHGTIDRAAADHLDLAEHDSGSARRAEVVRGFRMVPYAALVTIRVQGTTTI